MQLTLHNYIVPLFLAVVIIVALCLVRTIAFRLLHRWATKTDTKFDDIIIQSVKFPFLVHCNWHLCGNWRL